MIATTSDLQFGDLPSDVKAPNMLSYTGNVDVTRWTVFGRDMDAAFAVAGAVRKVAYGTDWPQCASTITQVTPTGATAAVDRISFTAVLSD